MKNEKIEPTINEGLSKTIPDDFPEIHSHHVSLPEATSKLAALVTLSKAKNSKAFEANQNLFYEAMGEGVEHADLPVLLEDPDWVSSKHQTIARIFPDIWSETNKLADLGESGKSLMAESGFKEIKSKGAGDLYRFIGMTNAYEQHFKENGPGIVDFLKSPEGKKSIMGGLKAASWGIAFVTGGIYLKAGIAAAGYLIGKTSENEKVKSLCGGIADKSFSAISKVTGVKESSLRESAEKTKNFLNKNYIKYPLIVLAAVGLSSLPETINIDIPEINPSSDIASNRLGGIDFETPNSAERLDDLQMESSEAEAVNIEAKENSLADLLERSAQMEGIEAAGAESELAGAVSYDPISYEVKSGDSLWKIAERHLESSGVQATNQEIKALEIKLYEANKSIIGSDPNKIFPGQVLQIDMAPKIPEVSLEAPVLGAVDFNPGIDPKIVLPYNLEMGKTSNIAFDIEKLKDEFFNAERHSKWERLLDDTEPQRG